MDIKFTATAGRSKQDVRGHVTYLEVKLWARDERDVKILTKVRRGLLDGRFANWLMAHDEEIDGAVEKVGG